MSEEDLKKLKEQMRSVQAAEVKTTKKNIALLKAAKAEESGWRAAQAHDALEEKAAFQASSDAAHADSLLHNI